MAVRVLGALTFLLVLCGPFLTIAADQVSGPRASRPSGAGGTIAAALALAGLGLNVVALVLAPLDWAAAGRTVPGGRPDQGRLQISVRNPRTWARPLAYTVVQLTVGGATAVAGALTTITAVVAITSPLLVLSNDSVDIGPFVVDDLASSLTAAAAGVALLALLACLSPPLSMLHSELVLALLTVPEERLAHDLTVTTRSRDRVLRAFDLERRRIERDLHDGIQPQLMSVSMTLGLALAALPEDAPGRAEVVRAQAQSRSTVEDLRRFVRSIHPQVLTDRGLVAAIGELTDNLGVSTTVEDELDQRLPPVVETNLYFCVAELLTNVVKHAAAHSAYVRLRHDEQGNTEVCVRDDGKGGACGRTDGGIAGVADRVGALGGTFTMTSPPGGPTEARIVVPAQPQQPTEAASARSGDEKDR